VGDAGGSTDQQVSLRKYLGSAALSVCTAQMPFINPTNSHRILHGLYTFHVST